MMGSITFFVLIVVGDDFFFSPPCISRSVGMLYTAISKGTPIFFGVVKITNSHLLARIKTNRFVKHYQVLIIVFQRYDG